MMPEGAAAARLRTLGRARRLAWEIVRAGCEGAGQPRLSLGTPAARTLRALGVELTVAGPVPGPGLVVCNHLGYLDVLVLAACMPAVFVAKREVASWPVFGWFARRSGTLFVDRTRPRDCARIVLEMRRALVSGRSVILFPEGTSSGGAQVLPFRSPLLEAAGGFPVAAAALSYSLEPGDGDPAHEVCYWRDMTFGPHLLRLLSRRRIHAGLAFAPAEKRPAGDRKALARQLQGEVTSLLGQLRFQTSGKWEPRMSSPSFTRTNGFMQ